ncbi:hypothetical protein ACFW4K_06390 [Nocardiopsis alba]|uniref:hypothetical protein n=1 Tax=Nocardiopsis alba TaxID=53437 RepID=UPI00367266EA
MRGIGFIPGLWLQKARRERRFARMRTFCAATIIADAVDPDGGFCFFHLNTMVERSGGMLSLSSAQRGIVDLIEAGMVRKLDPEQARIFFAREIARGRSPHRLPCVLELLIPMEDFPEPVLAEINEARAALGEEPLTRFNRPRLRPPPPRPATRKTDKKKERREEEWEDYCDEGRWDTEAPEPFYEEDLDAGQENALGEENPFHDEGSSYEEEQGTGDPEPPETEDPLALEGERTEESTPGRSDMGPRSDRPTDLFPGEGFQEEEVAESVRGREGTGRAHPREEPPGEEKPRERRPRGRGVYGRIALIPDGFLLDPPTDRERLEGAVERLTRRGFEPRELLSLFRGVESLRRPFPALMSRLRSPEAARAFLDGRLGTFGAAGEPDPRAAMEGGDPSRDPTGFVLDSQGRANLTCPRHPSVRNVPGGTCAGCGGPCRSTPGEELPPPPAADTGAGGAARETPTAAAAEEPREVEDFDPVLAARMRESLARGGGPVPPPRGSEEDSGPSARRREIIGRLRERLSG